MYDIEETSTEGYAPNDWADRCRYWLAQHDNARPNRKRREREKIPLILTGHGLSMRVDKGRLIIRDGNTHYPSPKRQFEYFPGSLDIPPRIVVVDGSGSITLDAMDWLAAQDVVLVRLKWDGAFVSITSSGGQAASSEKVVWQQATRDDPDARRNFALGLIKDKATATLETMESHVPRSRFWAPAMAAMEKIAKDLEINAPSSLSDVLGAEGGLASHYFRAWQGLEISWKSTGRYPIPGEWRVYKSRSAVHVRQRIGNRGATHPVNAMLNYVYALLQSQMQVQAIAQGYDPTLGIVHDARKRDRGRVPAFVLDLMEPQRPVVDRTVLKLVREERFFGADFLLQSDGTVRLGPDLARWLVGELVSLVAPRDKLAPLLSQY